MARFKEQRLKVTGGDDSWHSLCLSHTADSGSGGLNTNWFVHCSWIRRVQEESHRRPAMIRTVPDSPLDYFPEVGHHCFTVCV